MHYLHTADHHEDSSNANEDASWEEEVCSGWSAEAQEEITGQDQDTDRQENTNAIMKKVRCPVSKDIMGVVVLHVNHYSYKILNSSKKVWKFEFDRTFLPSLDNNLGIHSTIENIG